MLQVCSDDCCHFVCGSVCGSVCGYGIATFTNVSKMHSPVVNFIPFKSMMSRIRRKTAQTVGVLGLRILLQKVRESE
jgi:hypothetical protein